MAAVPTKLNATLTDAAGVDALTVATGGAVTVGPTTSYTGLTHTAYGMFNIRRAETSGSPILAEFRNDATTSEYLQFGVDVSAKQTFQNFTYSSGGQGHQFRAVNSVIGSYSVAGAWTLGPASSGALTHIIRSGDTTTVDIQAANAVGKNAILLLSCNGYNAGTISYERATGYLRASSSNSAGPYVQVNGTGWTTGSDYRLKNILQNSTPGLASVLQLKPTTYTMKADEQNRTHFGFIAQEVGSVLPSVVVGKDLVEQHPDDDSFTLGLDYQEFIPVLVKAIQEQQALIVAQAQALAEHQSQIDSLLAAVAALKGE
jgi:hypothetical protein